jgi:hypothetical protein
MQITKVHKSKDGKISVRFANKLGVAFDSMDEVNLLVDSIPFNIKVALALFGLSNLNDAVGLDIDSVKTKVIK